MSLRQREKIQKVLRRIDSGETNFRAGRPLRIAGIQFSASPDKQANIRRAEHFAKIALDKGAKILCFSELFTVPWFHPDDDDFKRLAEPIPGESTEPFFHLAETFKAVILCPVYERHEDTFYSSVAVIDESGLLGTYRKNYIPDVPYWEEHLFFQPGNLGHPVFNTRYGVIGVQVCWDNFFPESTRMLALNGAEIIFAPTAAALDSQSRWQSIIIANAVENNVYVFRVNRTGKEQELEFYGKSFCVDPFGEFAATPAFHKDAIVLADIDLDIVSLARKEFPFLHKRRVELYSGLLKPAPER